MASRTERVRAHTVSSVVDRGSAPSVGTSRAVFLKPTMPLSAAGMRIEPPVSEPRPTKAAPVATDTAAPDDDPPGIARLVQRRSAGLAGVPKCGLMPTPEKANSVMLVRPRIAPPAARRRATAGSLAARGASASTVEPAAVAWPAMSNRSLTDTARPASGRSGQVLAAAFRASSNMVRKKALAQAGDLGCRDGALQFGGALVRPARRRCALRQRSESMWSEGKGPVCYTLWVLLKGA
jgi:hypothetical protein